MSALKKTARFLGDSGLFVLGFVLLYSVWRGYRLEEALDYKVFHHAFDLVWKGQGAEIYGNSPDRYLYAPGFAYLLSPLSELGWKGGFLFLSLVKIAAVFHVLAMVRERLPRPVSWGVLSWGALIATRALMIDFRYGQVNWLFAWLMLVAMLLHLGDHRSRRLAWVSWSVASIVAVAKIVLIPFLLIPWLRRGRSVGIWERVGTLMGPLVMIGLPFIFSGPEVAGTLLSDWRQALLSRGFPLESHNQSISAIFHHLFSDAPILVIGLHDSVRVNVMALNEPWLSIFSVGLIGVAALALTGFLVWPFFARKEVLWRPFLSLPWALLLVAGSILPSHLVWKPYFVSGLGLGAWVAARVVQAKDGRAGLGLATLILFANLSSNDVIGPWPAAYFEAVGGLMWAHLGLMMMAAMIWVRDLKKPTPGLG